MVEDLIEEIVDQITVAVVEIHQGEEVDVNVNEIINEATLTMKTEVPQNAINSNVEIHVIDISKTEETGEKDLVQDRDLYVAHVHLTGSLLKGDPGHHKEEDLEQDHQFVAMMIIIVAEITIEEDPRVDQEVMKESTNHKREQREEIHQQNKKVTNNQYQNPPNL